jgi:hypothetical protein
MARIEKTETLFLTGLVNYPKVYKPDEKFKNYVIDFFPDAESEKKMKDAGVGLEANEQTDPAKGATGTFYRLRRPVSKDVKGELREFGPPKVVLNTGEIGEDGVPITVPFKELIGNGSAVAVRVTVYPAGPYVGHRLEAVRVDKHIPYVPKERAATPDYPF